MAEAPREVAHYLAAPALSAGFLSHSVWVCVGYKLCRYGGTSAALHGYSIRESRLAHPPHAESRQLQVFVHRRSLRSFIPLFAEDRIFLDSDLPGPGVSDGLCHRPDFEEYAKRPAAHHHLAVLDLVPAAGLRARGNHSGNRLAQYCAPVVWRDPPSIAD